MNKTSAVCLLEDAGPESLGSAGYDPIADDLIACSGEIAVFGLSGLAGSCPADDVLLWSVTVTADGRSSDDVVGRAGYYSILSVGYIGRDHHREDSRSICSGPKPPQAALCIHQRTLFARARRPLRGAKLQQALLPVHWRIWFVPDRRLNQLLSPYTKRGLSMSTHVELYIFLIVIVDIEGSTMCFGLLNYVFFYIYVLWFFTK